VAQNPGISIKLSALFPRYEEPQRDRVMAELVPRVTDLVRAARDAGIGISIDAEEADRLDLSLDVIEAVARDPGLDGWDGFGIVVQAYSRRASAVIGWTDALAASLNRRMMVRLVKGAYWDTEIKRAQAEGLDGFPVFTRKAATDVSYLACARRLFDASDRLFPQFATHNAHTVAAILQMAENRRDGFEFQRCTAWARPCTRWCGRTTASPAASTRRWGGTGTSWPISCGGFWRTGRTRPS
jgi:RHH-type proline utilization regulon transcriptional repressor/proline dehydrogenase/delta 1-pyrroline-5-carboxylate dehydrogenase